MVKVVAASLIGGLISATPVHAARGTAAPHLVLRIYDTSGTDQKEMNLARSTVHTVFNRAGIDVAWLDCTHPSPGVNPGCDHAVGTTETIIRIIAGGSRQTGRTLGYSFGDGHRNSACLATVLADRVDDVARRAQAEMGTLLGYVIVHEVGHILLGSDLHSPIGLMRADWSDYEIRRNWLIDWSLTRGDAKQLRLGLLGRSSR